MNSGSCESVQLNSDKTNDGFDGSPSPRGYRVYTTSETPALFVFGPHPKSFSQFWEKDLG